MKYSLTVCEHIFKAEARNIGAKDAQCFINTLTLQLASCSLNIDYSWFCHNTANNCETNLWKWKCPRQHALIKWLLSPLDAYHPYGAL